LIYGEGKLKPKNKNSKIGAKGFKNKLGLAWLLYKPTAMQSPQDNTSSTDQQLKSQLNFTKSKTDRLAVFIIDILGSMIFLVICLLVFTLWICWNLNLLPGLKPFDPFPFATLNMVVSLFAIVLSVSVLIKQNRQGRIENISRQVEFEVNVRAESEITKILNMLHEIHQHIGLQTRNDEELEEMKEPTDLNQIHQTLYEQDGAIDNSKPPGIK
jgi:uncharacterized membrane protein